MVRRNCASPARPLRLLVESDDSALLICDFVAFANGGFDVLVCSGPSDEHACPAMDGRRCSFVQESDVVLNAIRDPFVQRVVTDAVHATALQMPIVASVDPETAIELPSATLVIDEPMSVAGQVAAVRRAATCRTR